MWAGKISGEKIPEVRDTSNSIWMSLECKHPWGWEGRIQHLYQQPCILGLEVTRQSNSLFYPLKNEDETLNLMSMKQYEQSD